MPVSLDVLLDDLLAETTDVEAMLAPLDDDAITRPTPAVGWDIRDQVTHLAFFDETATRAAVDPEGFRLAAAALLADGMDFPDRVAAQHRGWARRRSASGSGARGRRSSRRSAAATRAPGCRGTGRT